MRIAVTHKDGSIFQHFGHSEEFKIYDVEDKKVVNIEVISTNGSGHGALAEILKNLNTNVLICGGIGAGAQNILKNMNIEIYAGITGSCAAAVVMFLEGRLPHNNKPTCNHHDHECKHDCSSKTVKLTRM